MIEQTLEAALLAKISALNIQNVRIVGLWQTASDGSVKGAETEDDISGVISASIGPRAYNEYDSPVATFAGAVSLVFRRDSDATGAQFLAAANSVAGLLNGYQSSLATAQAAFVATGFTFGGFRFSGGDGPTYSASASAYSLTLNFELTGVIAA